MVAHRSGDNAVLRYCCPLEQLDFQIWPISRSLQLSHLLNLCSSDPPSSPSPVMTAPDSTTQDPQPSPRPTYAQAAASPTSSQTTAFHSTTSRVTRSTTATAVPGASASSCCPNCSSHQCCTNTCECFYNRRACHHCTRPNCQNGPSNWPSPPAASIPLTSPPRRPLTSPTSRHHPPAAPPVGTPTANPAELSSRAEAPTPPTASLPQIPLFPRWLQPPPHPTPTP